MYLGQDDRVTVEHQFDRLCKKVMLGEARSCKKERAKRSQKEISINEVKEIATYDEYEIENTFQWGDEVFTFKNDFLYEAVRLLEKDKRNIILLSYFLEMTDEEIARTLKAIRRTINYKRNRALKELKKRLEDWNEY
ncbi:RNA polymerase sigma factor [Clostridium formicaceticum]|uniref:RNA polymerase sigma factor n=1 Tax=Clostridium formicaceticum TaxID=1497 RepID=A0AAC9RL51_9CLOT|nr:sigma-70 region 4 domain-containing protein [Clostridium formicaceticum]AOY74719.1 hypothetical protein BJL90_01370 [Clostridium formicaceticum]ARE89104.1 RNA polymerase sigma factor [Clostridium formicaceticum]